MASKKITAMPDLAGGQVPTDLLTAVDLSQPTATQNVKATFNDTFAEITKNVTDLSVQFANGLGTATVSAANKGKIIYNSTAQSFQVSENGGAYENLVKGSGANTRVAYWTDTDTLSSDSAFLWDSANDRLLINVSIVNGAAPIDVSSDAGAIAQRWRETAGGPALIEMQVPSSFGQLGTVSNHDFALMTQGIQRVNIESGGAVVIGGIVPATAELMVNALVGTSISLIANNTTGTSVDIAQFQVNAANRFRFLNTGEAIFGLAATATGKLTLANSAGATLTSISAGNAASTLNYILPATDPTVGQFLQAAAPSGGNVVMSWATASGGTTINPTDGVMPVRSNATTFIDSPLSVASSAVTMTRSAIGSTSSDGIILLNATAAAAGAQQFSPRLRLTGQGWKTNATAASQTVDWIIENQPVQAASAPISDLVFSYQVNAGGYAPIFSMDSAGILYFGATSAPNIKLATNGLLFGTANYRAYIGGTNTALAHGILIASAGVIGFTSDSNVSGFTNADTTFARHSASVFRVANGGTGIGSLLIATSTDSLTGNFTVMGSNAATNAIVDMARLGVNSTGTAAAGFGGRLSFSAESSTTNDSQIAGEQWFWNEATHATRTGALSWSIVNNATVSEYMRLTPAGGGGTFVNTAACLVVHEGTAPSIWTAGSYAAKLYLLGAAAVPATGVAANFSTTTLAGPVWQMLRGRGTNASPAAIQTADVLGEIQWNGQFNTSTNNQTTGCAIRAVSTETWANGANGSGLFFYTSPTGGTITLRASLENTGTLRLGATSGSFNTTTLLQVGNYASWNTDVVAAIYTGANGTKGLEIIGTAGQTASPFRIFNTTVTPDLLTVSAAGVLATWAGAGTLQANHGGVLDVNTTTTSNTGTGETDLLSFTLPQNTLNTNGDFVRVEGSGTFEVSANNKQLRFYIDNTVLFDTTALGFAAATASSWRVTVTIIRTASNLQSVIAQFVSSDAILNATATYTGSAEDLTTNLVLKFTGQGGASDEVYQENMIVEWNPNA